jgi:hypothetical protein
MLNLTTADTLVSDHRRRLLDEAGRRRLELEARDAGRVRVRAWAGLLLVSAGLRLAGRPAGTQLATTR